MDARQGRRAFAGRGVRVAAGRVVKIMREMKNTLRVVGILLLGLFVLVVGVPLVLAAAGIIVSSIIGIAVLLIKVGVTLAVGYLILVGVRALLR
jgi:hypothetical protein